MSMRLTRMVSRRACSKVLLLLLGTLVYLPATHAQDAQALKARYMELREELASNAYQRPLYLESRQTSSELQGDIYASSGLPFAVVGPALQGVDHWCDILILHLNVKGCRASAAGADDMLKISIGRKEAQALEDAYDFDFLYRTVTTQSDYLRATLEAKSGPLGTRDYRIVLEVVALDAERSFLHISYSYAYGMAARMAMKGYLATSGRKKLGFSVVGHKPTGEPVYIGGMRGVVERNTMRYYLAIEAYLGALSTPVHKQVTKRLNDWYAGIERYPVQLRELERDEYLAIKRKEIARQEALASAAGKSRKSPG